jgi:hypothetical protein
MVNYASCLCQSTYICFKLNESCPSHFRQWESLPSHFRQGQLSDSDARRARVFPGKSGTQRRVEKHACPFVFFFLFIFFLFLCNLFLNMVSFVSIIISASTPSSIHGLYKENVILLFILVVSSTNLREPNKTLHFPLLDGSGRRLEPRNRAYRKSLSSSTSQVSIEVKCLQPSL